MDPLLWVAVSLVGQLVVEIAAQEPLFGDVNASPETIRLLTG